MRVFLITIVLATSCVPRHLVYERGLIGPARPKPIDGLSSSLEPGRTPVSALTQIEALLRDKSAAQIDRFVDQHSLHPINAYYLRYGSFPFTGAVDLRPPLRLRVTGPAPDGKSATQAWFTLAPLKIEEGATPTQLPAAKHHRLLFLTRSADFDHSQILIFAENPTELEKRTQAAKLDPKGCEGCWYPPKGTVLAAEIRVTVNGQPRRLPIDARVSALKLTGKFRLYRGSREIVLKDDPNTLVLLGDERITLD